LQILVENKQKLLDQIPFGVADFIRETQSKYNYNKVENKILMTNFNARKREDESLLKRINDNWKEASNWNETIEFKN